MVQLKTVRPHCQFARQTLATIVLALLFAAVPVSAADLCQQVFTNEAKLREIIGSRITHFGFPDTDEHAPAGFGIGVKLTLDGHGLVNVEYDTPSVIAEPVRFRKPSDKVLQTDKLIVEGNDSYEVANIGGHQLKPFWDSIEKRIIETAQLHKESNVYIPVSTKFWNLEQRLSDMQMAISNHTTKVYKSKKGYLLNDDLGDLLMQDVFNLAIADHFVILKNPKKPLLEMNNEEFTSSVALGLKVVRPSGYISKGLSLIEDKTDRISLPFVKRLSIADQKKMDEYLKRLKTQGRQVAELSRFSKYQDIPPELVKFIVKNALNLSRDPKAPIDTFFMTCDQVMRRVFAEYKFKEFAEISESGSEVKEYVMYLDTKSEDFASVMKMLEEKTSSISVVSQKPNSSNVKIGLDGWDLKDDYFRYTGSLRWRKSEKDLKTFEKQFGQLSDVDKKVLSTLDNQAPASGNIVVLSNVSSAEAFLQSAYAERNVSTLDLRTMAEADSVLLVDKDGSLSSKVRNQVFKWARHNLGRNRKLLYVRPVKANTRQETDSISKKFNFVSYNQGSWSIDGGLAVDTFTRP